MEPLTVELLLTLLLYSSLGNISLAFLPLTFFRGTDIVIY